MKDGLFLSSNLVQLQWAEELVLCFFSSQIRLLRIHSTLSTLEMQCLVCLPYILTAPLPQYKTNWQELIVHSLIQNWDPSQVTSAKDLTLQVFLKINISGWRDRTQIFSLWFPDTFESKAESAFACCGKTSIRWEMYCTFRVLEFFQQQNQHTTKQKLALIGWKSPQKHCLFGNFYSINRNKDFCITAENMASPFSSFSIIFS